MNTAILLALKKHLEGNLNVRLLGQSLESDAVTPVSVFIGDLPPPEKGRKTFPCIILIPVGGHHDGGIEAATIALICCVYNPETGDAEGAEQDLARLMSDTGRVLCSCRETPLQGRFILTTDSQGRLLPWEKTEMKPRPFTQAVMLSCWQMKGWE